jgi:hypothetical protein
MAGRKEPVAAAVLLALVAVALHQVAVVVAVAGVHRVHPHLADQSAIRSNINYGSSSLQNHKTIMHALGFPLKAFVI